MGDCDERCGVEVLSAHTAGSFAGTMRVCV